MVPPHAQVLRIDFKDYEKAHSIYCIGRDDDGLLGGFNLGYEGYV